jgi:hypothetical protein
MNKEFSHLMFVGIMLNNSPVTEDKIVDEVERLLKKQFIPSSLHPHRMKDKDMTQMFNQNLTSFKLYLTNEFAPKIYELQSIFYRYTFESPLNFLMI